MLRNGQVTVFKLLQFGSIGCIMSRFFSPVGSD